MMENNDLEILLVEDNLINQEIALNLLQATNAKIAVVNNGQEALHWLNAHQRLPDLVLMDLQMPVMDGFIATRHIFENPAWHDLKVIAMTAHAFQEEKDRCLALGMVDHISKPIVPAVIYSQLANLLAVTEFVKSKEPGEHMQQSSSTTEVDFFDALAIEGMNKQAVKELFIGVEDVLNSAIYGFVNEYADAFNQIELLLTQDRGSALRFVHTLKGLCATLGLMEIATYFADLEQSIKRGDSLAVDWATHQQISDYAKVIDSMRVHCERHGVHE